jgi:hypothetical protein
MNPPTKINNLIFRNNEQNNYQKIVTNFLNPIDLEEAIKSDPSNLIDQFRKQMEEAASKVANRPVKKTPGLVH